MKFFLRLPTKTEVSTLVDKVVGPIKAGGLGMVKLQDMNHSLWTTWWWWFGKDWDALCRRFGCAQELGGGQGFRVGKVPTVHLVCGV